MSDSNTRSRTPRSGGLPLFAALLLLAVVLSGFALRPADTLSPRFNHVMLYVSDLERSIDFYTEAFDVRVTQRVDGLTLVGEDGSETPVEVRMAFLRFPGQEFVLELSEQAVDRSGPGPGTPTPGLQHLGVDVTDIEAAAERVLATGAPGFTGVRTVRTSNGTVAKNAFFRGPDGELLELMQLIEGEF